MINGWKLGLVQNPDENIIFIENDDDSHLIRHAENFEAVVDQTGRAYTEKG